MKNPSQNRRRAVAAIGFALAFAALAPAAAVQAGKSTAPAVNGQVVVAINPLSGATIDDINATFGTTTVDQLPAPFDGYLLAVPDGQSVRDVLERMEPDLRLAASEPNFVGELPEAKRHTTWAWGGFDASAYSANYALAMLGIDQAHALALGRGAVVAVVDTGAELDHPALAASLVAGYDFVDGDGLPADEGNLLDDDADGDTDEGVGHGTHVAGIVHIVAPAAKIMPLRALNSDGRGTIFAVAQAIAYASAHGAQAINVSLGTESESQVLADAIMVASHAGSLVVAAAGNEGTNVAVYPAAGACALSITSIGPTSLKSSFANYGNKVAFAAPGESIWSSFPVGGYASGSGTSMAAAWVTGQVALIQGVAPAADPLRVARLMSATARSLDSTNPSFKGRLGAGRPDVRASVASAVAGIWPTSGKGIYASSCVN
jgi:subtilisin family serine protease